MDITKKPMRAGYQGKPDAMRDLADKLMDHPGYAPDVYPSKSAADNSKMRPYKEGGSVTKCSKKKQDMNKDMDMTMKKNMKIEKFAMGGVAKIRHEEATTQGLPKKFKKAPAKNFL